MKVLFLKNIQTKWYEKLPKTKLQPRHYQTLVPLEIQLSDGYILNIPQGFIWDGASVPSCLHWLFPPIDEGALADLIHDKLWLDKQAQFEYFQYNIYKARKFADDERRQWRNELAPKRKFFNWISHKVIRLIGGFYYSKQLNIPK